MAIVEIENPDSRSDAAESTYGAVSHHRGYTSHETRFGRMGKIVVSGGAVLLFGLIVLQATESGSGSPPSVMMAQQSESGPQIHDLLPVHDIEASGDLDVDRLYHESESKLLDKIENKLEKNVEAAENQEVEKRLNEAKKQAARKHLANLVSQISDEMFSVSSGLKNIDDMKLQQAETIRSISDLEKDIDSDESRELFLQAAAWLLKDDSNGTDCNGTLPCNSTGNSSNATDAAEGDAEAAEGDAAEGEEETASERVIHPNKPTTLRYKTNKSPAWERKEESTMNKMMASWEAARTQQRTEESALTRMMRQWDKQMAVAKSTKHKRR